MLQKERNVELRDQRLVLNNYLTTLRLRRNHALDAHETALDQLKFYMRRMAQMRVWKAQFQEMFTDELNLEVRTSSYTHYHVQQNKWRKLIKAQSTIQEEEKAKSQPNEETKQE